jgi:hypothetical protein
MAHSSVFRDVPRLKQTGTQAFALISPKTPPGIPPELKKT